MTSRITMPTAARLAAALFFCALGYLLSGPYAQNGGGGGASWLHPAGAVSGAFCGWWIMGGAIAQGRGWLEAMGVGLRTALTVALVLVVFSALYMMLTRAWAGGYRDPMAAVLAVFDLSLMNGRRMFTIANLELLLPGGMIGGLVARWVGGKWK